MYASKYATTAPVFSLNVRVVQPATDDQHELVEVVGRDWKGFLIVGQEIHRTYEEACAQAAKRRRDRIRALQKQIWTIEGIEDLRVPLPPQHA